MEKVKMFLGYTEYGEVMFMEFDTHYKHREYPTLKGQIWKCKPWLINREKVENARKRIIDRSDVDSDYLRKHYGTTLEYTKMRDKWVEDTEFWDIDYLFPHIEYDKMYTKKDFDKPCQMEDEDIILFKDTSVCGVPSGIKLYDIDESDVKVLMHLYNYYDCGAIPQFWINEIEEIAKKCGAITEEIEKEIKTLINKMI